MCLKRFKKLIFMLCAWCFIQPVLGAGFQLSEYSVTHLGRAFSGAGVVGDDYSSIAFNPAGMGLKNSGAQMGATLIAIKASVKGETVNGLITSGKEGSIRLYSFIPHAFTQYRFNEKWVVGLGIYAPFGLSTNYNNDWFGRTHALKSYVSAMDIAPSFSYQVTDQFFVGSSFVLERANAELTNRLPSTWDGENKVRGDDWTMGYQVGVMYRPQKDTRFGLDYRSKFVHDLRGKHKVTGSTEFGGMFKNGYTAGSAKLTLPEHVLFSAYHKVNKFGLSASAKWTRWSRFKNLDVYSSNFVGGYSRTKENWEDVWMLSVGLDYHYNNNWTFRCGFAFDESPVKNPTYRTARIPDNDHWLTSVGLSYYRENVQIDAGYTHIYIPPSRTYNVASGSTLDAKYNMQANLLGVQMQYHF